MEIFKLDAATFWITLLFVSLTLVNVNYSMPVEDTTDEDALRVQLLMRLLNIQNQQNCKLFEKIKNKIF